MQGRWFPWSCHVTLVFPVGSLILTQSFCSSHATQIYKKKIWHKLKLFFRRMGITFNNFWHVIINQSHLISTVGLWGNSISTPCQVVTVVRWRAGVENAGEGYSCASWGPVGNVLARMVDRNSLNSLYTFIKKKNWNTLKTVEILHPLQAWHYSCI